MSAEARNGVAVDVKAALKSMRHLTTAAIHIVLKRITYQLLSVMFCVMSLQFPPIEISNSQQSVLFPVCFEVDPEIGTTKCCQFSDYKSDRFLFLFPNSLSSSYKEEPDRTMTKPFIYNAWITSV